MKIRLVSLGLICCLSLPGVAFAQAPKKDEKKAPAPKSPADLALDEFNKARNAPGAKNQARFQQVISTGIAYLIQHPTHGSVPGAINNLAFYAGSLAKNEAPLKVSYLSNLKLEVTNQKYKEGISDNVKTMLAALEAAIADFEVRENFNRDNLAAFREKIDELTPMPGAGRYLTDREKSYIHIVTLGSTPQRGEDHAKKLLEHKEKGVKDMARSELNIFEIKKEPYGLKFTTLDGKEVDFAQLRGKVVALYFWATTNKGSTDRLEQLKQIQSDNRKKGLEVVTVSYDKEEDRAKLTKFIKDNRIPFPVYFDGKAAKNDFSPKLNVYSVPRLLVFDQKGHLFTTLQGNPIGSISPNIEVNQLDGVFKRLTEPAKKK